jgi:hypothetical protein
MPDAQFNKKGEEYAVTLQYLKYVPDLWVSLFSINKTLKMALKSEMMMS